MFKDWSELEESLQPNSQNRQCILTPTLANKALLVISMLILEVLKTC